MQHQIVRVFLLITLAVASTLGTAPRAHEEGEDGCTLVTLKGSWGFLLNGTIIGVGPIAIEGVVQFDGAGNFTRDERAVVNGHVLPPEHITGTYTVSSDCTGTMLDSAGRTSEFSIVSNRKELLSIGTGNGSVVTIVLKKQ
jgi:hypothetical protein